MRSARYATGPIVLGTSCLRGRQAPPVGGSLCLKVGGQATNPRAMAATCSSTRLAAPFPLSTYGKVRSWHTAETLLCVERRNGQSERWEWAAHQTAASLDGRGSIVVGCKWGNSASFFAPASSRGIATTCYPSATLAQRKHSALSIPGGARVDNGRALLPAVMHHSP